jgi:F420H(2)-dependent quinone reductase
MIYVMPKPPPPESPFWKLFRGMAALNTKLFRLTKGRVGGHFLSMHILILHHVGAKSGQRRETPLNYVRDGDELAVVASKGGVDKHPAWFHNVVANPDVEVELPGGERRQVRARVLEGEERERWWDKAVAGYAPYAEYQTYTERKIPVVKLDAR